jgi:MFS family permease
MGDLVPKEERGKYFGSRNKITGFFGFISVIFAGLILNKISNIDIFLGFAVLFVIAFLTRFLSLLFLRKQYDPPHTIKTEERIGFKNFSKNLRRSNFGLFSSYVSMLHLTTNVAGPFFAVYMLMDLQISYSQYAIITGAAAISTFLTMSYWGRVSDLLGNKKILEITGFLVALIPFLWLLNNRFLYLVMINLFSGFAWAGFNLSSSNFIFDSTSPKTRAESVSYFNLFKGLAVVIGASIGSLLVLYLPALPFTKYSLLTLFLISGVGRLLTSLYYLPKIHEVRITEYKPRNLFRLITIGPIEGIIYEGISGLNKTIVKLKNGLKVIEKGTKKVEKNIEPKVKTDYKKVK